MTSHWRVLLHRYAGLTVTLFLIIVGLTGSVLAFYHELGRWFNPVVFSIIGAYYYLRIVKLMYFDDPEDTSLIVCGQDTRVVLSFNGLAVLALGF